MACLLLSACGGREPGAGAEASGGRPPAEAPAGAAVPAAAASAEAIAPTGRQRAGEPVVVEGLYRPLPGAGVLASCDGGAAWAVASDGRAEHLRTRHLAAGGSEDEPTLVRVAGRVDAAPDPPLLHVDSVLSVRGGGVCPGGGLAVPLAGIRWQAAADDPDAPWIRLDEETSRVDGFTGCRPLAAVFTVRGAELRFGSLAPVGACSDSDAAAVEAAFLEALRVTGSFEIHGDTLVLLGESGPARTLTASRTPSRTPSR